MAKEFDLLILAKSLDGNAKYKNLVELIGTYAGACSTLQDLDRAEDTLKGMLWAINFYESQPEEHRNKGLNGILTGSAFMQAVMFYMRATHKGSKGRKFIDVVDGMPQDLLDMHLSIKTIRNKALAHYEAVDDPYFGMWHDISVSLVIRDDVPPDVRFRWSGTNHSGILTQNLSDLLNYTIDRCLKIQTEAYFSLMGEINTHLKDAEFLSALDANPLDLTKYFKPESGHLETQGQDVYPSFSNTIKTDTSYSKPEP